MVSGTFASGKKREDSNIFLFISQILLSAFHMLGSRGMAMNDRQKVPELWKLKRHSM